MKRPQRRERRKPKGYKKSDEMRWMDLRGTNEHHVPPRHPDRQPRFLVRKLKTHHAAYHMLFRAAASLEDCIQILIHDWWTTPEQQKPEPETQPQAPSEPLKVLPGERIAKYS